MERTGDAKRAAEAAFSKRLTEAARVIQGRIDEIGITFDRLTRHGRSRSIDTKAGIEQAKQRFDNPPDRNAREP